MQSYLRAALTTSLCLAMALPALADTTPGKTADEKRDGLILVELVSSRRAGFKKRNRPWYRQPFGPKEYTYRTVQGRNYYSTEFIKSLPDRRPSEQRHPIESTVKNVSGHTINALSISGYFH